MKTQRFVRIGMTLVGVIVLGMDVKDLNAAEKGQTDVGNIASDVWRDVSVTPDLRARDLLGRLTLEEKIALLHADTTFTTPGVPRFGVPKLWMSDGPQGVREEIQAGTWNAANHTDDFSTAMPADIGLAATFDPELGKAFGNVIGEEAKTRGKNIMLCPGMNIMRTPLNGRNSEYLGEDPFLSGRMAVGFISGVQSHGVAACAKHFALNNQETQRGSVNVTVDERTMREIYLPAFKAAVTEGHVLTVMTAYNRVNGQYCSENEFLLTQVLKKEWGFTGLVMTDWGGCHSTLAAANNGLDLEMGSNVGGDHRNDFFNTALLDAVNSGKVSLARIDDMVLRNLRIMAATGSFDPPADQTKMVPLMTPAHIEAARKIAESACVLLKNDGNVLPIDSTKVKTVAVIGANAKAQFAHQGNSAQIKTRYEVTPLDGITRRAGTAIKINFTEGYKFISPRGGKRGLGGAVANTDPVDAASTPQMISDAVDAAKNADVAIVVAGLYRGQDQEGRDRPNMNLPAGQAELIAAVTKANPKTIVILTGGSPSVVEPWINDAAGLIMYWYGGTEGGNALARVLFGDVNPSGHLPCSWPRQLADSPAHFAGDKTAYPGTLTSWHDDPRKLTPETGPQETYSEGIFVGYRWYDAKNIEPLFPFGYGLSYTTFDIANLQIAKTAGDNSVATVEATVTNTGKRGGAAVVQVYVGRDHPSVPRPPRELKGFMKIYLNPGETLKVTIQLDRSAFAYFSADRHCWVADAGDYTVYAGDSSRHLPVKATFSLPKMISFAEGE
jgi:beta-glucosidase